MPGIDYRRLSAHQPASGEQHVLLLKNLLDSFQGIVYVPQGGLHRFGRPVPNNLVSVTDNQLRLLRDCLQVFPNVTI